MSQQSTPTTFDRLMLNVSRAAWNERFHQERCPARADLRECRACLDYEAIWLDADRALNAFLDAASMAKGA